MQLVNLHDKGMMLERLDRNLVSVSVSQWQSKEEKLYNRDIFGGNFLVKHKIV